MWLVVAGLALVPITGALVRLAGLPSGVGALGLVGVLAILAGGAFALVAVVRRAERSILVLVTFPVWLLALMLVIGELASPH